MTRSSLLLVAAVLVPVWGAAAEIINVPGDQPSIGEALGAAVNGDEIVLAPGTYFEQVDLQGKAITLRSTSPFDAAVVAATIIDGGGSGPVVTCTSGETLWTIVQGLTITNGGGAGAIGGGMFIDNSGPTVHECVFSANVGTGVASRGGAIHSSGGDANIWNCRFSGNAAQFGGAIYAEFDSDLIITGCEFDQNQAYSSGGALYYTGDAIITDCEFTNNSCPSTGGGVYACCSDGAITNSTFIGNTAATGGGGYLVEDGTTVTGCTFNGNSSTFGGGGLYVTDLGDVHVNSCNFTGNLAGTVGGGLTAVLCDMTLSNSYFCGNAPNATDGCYVNGGGNTFDQWCFSFVPDDWIWFDPFEWDDVLTGLDYDLLAQVTFDDAAVLPGKPVLFDDPLNVLTDNGVFEPCAIPSFVCIKSNVNEGGVAGEAPRGADGLMAAGEGYMDLPAVAVMPTVDDDGLDIVLLSDPMMTDECYPPDPISPGAAIGIRYCALSFGEPLIVSLYDQDDVLIGSFEVFPKQSETAPCGFIGIAVMNGQLTGTGERTRIGRVNIWSFTHELEAITELIVYGFEPCTADLSGDGIVNTVDLLMLLSAWGSNPGGPPDFNDDGVVNTTDLLFLLGAWGNCS